MHLLRFLPQSFVTVTRNDEPKAFLADARPGMNGDVVAGDCAIGDADIAPDLHVGTEDETMWPDGAVWPNVDTGQVYPIISLRTVENGHAFP